MNENIIKLNEKIKEADNIVFFGGAGVSTESGIPDFRSQDGLYQQKYDVPPETILSKSFFMKHPEIFYEFYHDKMIYLQAKPNAAHDKLAKLEEQGKLKAVITQNIDGLHTKAGSKNVIELHGSIYRNYCMSCSTFYPIEYVLENKIIPKCTCGGMLKPDVVLYEEHLKEDDLSRAIEYIKKAEMLIVGGTSLNVYPAAGLLEYFSGTYLVLINRLETPFDKQADLVIRDNIGQVFDKIN